MIMHQDVNLALTMTSNDQRFHLWDVWYIGSLVLNKFKIDPALATGPFITTANDVFGLLLYFLMGWLMYF